MKNINCQIIKEEIQDLHDADKPANEHILSHLSECNECMKFYNAVKELGVLLENGLEKNILKLKKPDYFEIIEKSEKYKKTRFKIKFILNTAAVFILIIFGCISYLAVSRINLNYKVQNEIKYIVDDIFDENPAAGVQTFTDTVYLNDWRSDFGVSSSYDYFE
jgi:predicted anti-sigma-YlaC factor YlaD